MEVFLRAYLLLSPLLLQVASDASPGLLKVPKVYNALVTSDQNLAPSRAYPVIQPVVHRTAIGYAPPFYYPQIGPGFIGPEIIPFPHTGTGPNPQQTESATENPDAERVEVNEKNTEATKEKQDNDDNDNGKNGNRELVPLSFYPNYRSLYYNPYFYGYNPLPPVIPGNYYLDGPLVPVPPPPPPQTVPQTYPGSVRSITNSEVERKKVTVAREERKEKIPDVPPPPLPTKRVEKPV